MRDRRLHILIALFALAVGVLFPTLAWAATPATGPDASDAGNTIDRMVDRQLDAMDTTGVDEFLQNLDSGNGSALPDLSLRTVVDYLMRRRPLPSLGSIAAALAHFAFSALYHNAVLLGKLVTLAVLAALLRNIQAAFENDAVGRVAYSIVYLALAALAISSFSDAMGIARGIVDNLVGFMVALLPLTTALLASIGALTSATLLHPLIFMIVHFVSVLTADVFMPLLFLAAVLFIVDHFHAGLRVSSLAGLIQQVSLTALGLAMALFLGVVTVQGAAGAAIDGVAVRSAKFASKAFVPVLGSIFADTAELMIGSSLLLKNAASIYGMIGVFLITAYPTIQLLALIFIYRLAAALIQPIDDGATTGLLSSMAWSLTTLTLATAAVTAMFFMVITIVAGLGNMAVMMR